MKSSFQMKAKVTQASKTNDTAIMYKICFLSLVSIALISCTGNGGNDEIADRTNPNIKDILTNTTADTVFYDRTNGTIIGEIQRAKYHNDAIYLIDKSSNQIKAFSSDGEFKEFVGGSGRGPGEYLEPVSITIFDDNMIVLDRSLNRISHFIYDEASGEFNVQHSAIHDFYMTDICQANGRVWVYGYNEGNIIHQLSSDLEQIERSSGDLSAYEEDTIRDMARNGTIACAENHIYTAFNNDNSVHVYDQSDLSRSDHVAFVGIVPIQYTIVEHEGRE